MLITIGDEVGLKSDWSWIEVLITIRDEVGNEVGLRCL